MKSASETSLDSERRRRTILLALVLGVLLSSVTVLTASRAAFSDTTSNGSNVVSVGDVVLTDNDSDSALIEMVNVTPGDSETTCIQVTYEGSIADPSGVVVYSGGFTDSSTLANDINLTIEEGTGAGTFDDCTGFTLVGQIYSGTLANFDSTHSAYANGAGTWDPSSTPETRSYRFTVEVDSSAANTSQGQSVTDLIFTWEVQS
jgi:hypothetical protein